MRYGFGIDLGGTTVKLAFFDQTGLCLSKWEIPTVTKNSGSQILPDIAAEILHYLSENDINLNSVLGIGIGVPGPVRSDGTVNKCVNLGWKTVNIPKELHSLTGLPVVAGNDANIAALGECWKGGGQGCGNMVMITLGTGVGGGIIVDGKAVPGTHGAGGELGHITLNQREQQPCNCGKKGCAEQYCSATGIVRLAKTYLEDHNIPSTLRDIQDLTCKDIFDAAATDPAATAILEGVYQYMGQLLATVCCVTDPERIVIGGGVSKAGQPLLDGIRRHYEAVSFHACRDVEFTLAQLGNDAGTYGAFKLALDTLCPEVS